MPEDKETKQLTNVPIFSAYEVGYLLDTIFIGLAEIKGMNKEQLIKIDGLRTLTEEAMKVCLQTKFMDYLIGQRN